MNKEVQTPENEKKLSEVPVVKHTANMMSFSEFKKESVNVMEEYLKEVEVQQREEYIEDKNKTPEQVRVDKLTGLLEDLKDANVKDELVAAMEKEIEKIKNENAPAQVSGSEENEQLAEQLCDTWREMGMPEEVVTRMKEGMIKNLESEDRMRDRRLEIGQQLEDEKKYNPPTPFQNTNEEEETHSDTGVNFNVL